jgi:catechol 2,3-dioxygenase-like lactoylglutathione lyase family enzyme
LKFRLNFVGINIQDKAAALHFYRHICGMGVKSSSRPPMLWLETSGMMVEVFTAKARSDIFSKRTARQAVRPCIHVRSMKTVALSLKKNGVAAAAAEQTAHGQRMEVEAPDGIHWLLGEGKGFRHAGSLAKAYVGSADLRCIDLRAQLDFFTRILGLKNIGEFHGQVTLHDPAEGTFLTMQQFETDTRGTGYPAQPAFLSLATANIKAADEYLRSLGVKVVEPVIKHWFGTDMLILDADQNIIQVIQYK